MKKIRILLIALISILLIPIKANAASGTINVTGSSSVVVGNKITLTVTLSSGTAIGSWQMSLNYDKNYLQLVSTNTEANGTSMVNSSSGVKSKSYTFTFKALKSGNTRVSVPNYYIVANDFSEIDITSNSKSIRIMTQQELEATYSKDNNLKSLSVEGFELDKEFNKNTLEYKVDVPTGTTSIKINAVKNDSKASVHGAGEVTVTEGLNTIPITVTAQNGAEKTYTLLVNVEDLNPINVTVNGETLIIVKNIASLEAPNLYEATTVTINGTEIPAFYNNNTGITLVGLKNNNGEINLYNYNNNNYTIYNEINLNSLILMPVSFTEKLNYKKTKTTFNGIKTEAYKYSDNSDFLVINAMDVATGKVNLYLYDTINKTASRFDQAFMNENENQIKTYTNIIIGMGFLSLVLLIAVISISIANRKKSKKIAKFIDKQEAKIEATRRLNDVIDEVARITEEEKKTENKKKNKKEEVKTEEKVEENASSKPKAKKGKKKDSEVEVKEIQAEKQEITKEVAEVIKEELKEEDEMYNLFDDDKKKKKKK